MQGWHSETHAVCASNQMSTLLPESAPPKRRSGLPQTLLSFSPSGRARIALPSCQCAVLEASVEAKICQASKLFATRDNVTYALSPTRYSFHRPTRLYCSHWLTAKQLKATKSEKKIAYTNPGGCALPP